MQIPKTRLNSIPSRLAFRNSTLHYTLLLCSIKVKVKVTLRLTVSQSVSLGVEPPSGAHDQKFITVWQLRSCFCGAPSLTRGRICILYMLLALASAVFLGSEFLGTRDHILLSQIWDFLFRRLLRLAGSRWRYSTMRPRGDPVEHFLITTLHGPRWKRRFKQLLLLCVYRSVA
jgi:hypothetical protein